MNKITLIALACCTMFFSNTYAREGSGNNVSIDITGDTNVSGGGTTAGGSLSGGYGGFGAAGSGGADSGNTVNGVSINCQGKKNCGNDNNVSVKVRGNTNVSGSGNTVNGVSIK